MIVRSSDCCLDTIAVFVRPFVAVLTSMAVMWREEYICNARYPELSAVVALYPIAYARLGLNISSFSFVRTYYVVVQLTQNVILKLLVPRL